jgi:hypothetical protein
LFLEGRETRITGRFPGTLVTGGVSVSTRCRSDRRERPYLALIQAALHTGVLVLSPQARIGPADGGEGTFATGTTRLMEHVLGGDGSSATVLVHNPEWLGPVGGRVILHDGRVLRPASSASGSGARPGTGRAWCAWWEGLPRPIRAALDRGRVRPLHRGRTSLFLHLPVGKGRDVVRAP